jgi:hypothetical protein
MDNAIKKPDVNATTTLTFGIFGGAIGVAAIYEAVHGNLFWAAVNGGIAGFDFVIVAREVVKPIIEAIVSLKRP